MGQAARRSPRRLGHALGRLDLAAAELLRVVRVPAEVAGEEDGVDLAGLEERAGDLGEARDVLLAPAGEVDRVHERRGRRQGLGELARVASEPRQLEPGGGGEVGGDDSVPAAVRGERDPLPLGRRPVSSAWARSTTSFGEETSSIPAATAAASMAERSLASARVRARRAGAASVAPPARSTTGFPADEHARAKALPSRKSSR